MPAVLLTDRAVLSVSGAEARHFLQGLVTCDMTKISAEAPGFGALLTPQGKILFDFLIAQDGERFLLDTSREKAADLLKRLTFYRLRAKVELANLSDDAKGDEALAVVALFGDAQAPVDALVFADPRAKALGKRAILPVAAARAFAGDARGEYEAHRIACGVPSGGLDFAYGDAFPHETNMDLLNGVAFDKGCYVGQEVVSRMQHRGHARKRVLKVAIDGEVAPGAEIRAGEIAVGVLGGAQGGRGLATLRLDRLEDSNGAPLAAGDVLVSVLDRAPQGSP